MRSFIAIALIVVVIGFSSSAKAQEAGSCVKPLAACTQFIYMPELPVTAECCKPLAVALTSDLLCVCRLYGDGTFMAAFGVDAQAALSLPPRCSIKIDLATACLAALTPAPVPSSSPSTSPAPGSDDDSLSPDGTPISDETSPAGAPTTTVTTTPAPGGSTSAGSNIAMSGFAVLGSFLMWATIMFY